MSFVRYGTLLINLRNVIAVQAKNKTTLEFIYPLTNYYGGGDIYQNDNSEAYKVKVNDAYQELARLEKLMEKK